MAGDAEVGSIIGYLRLDRSDWDAELRAAGAKADELGRHSPDVRIRTNAPSAIAQLAAVAAATKRLQDAQGAEAVAEARLQSLRDRGVTDAGRLRAAEEAVAKARRSEAAATIALAAAQDANDRAMQKATSDTDKLAKKADEAKNTFTLGLIPALAAVAPAAVPIAAVAGGALIGLAPVAATVMLAVKGIGNQMKAGALQGTQFASSVNTLKGELTTLETTAAGGIMVGVNKAMSESAPLFHTVNQDVAVMSGQLGQIVAGAAPALVRILTDLNPLFVTFGSLLANGASRLDHWAQSSTGVTHFVTYVQAELPTVMSFLGNLITLVAHLAEGMAPFGGALLNDINLLVHALDQIPIPVLQAATPAVVALYVAFKTYGGITSIVAKVNAALTAHAATATAAAATVATASRSEAQSAADEAAAVADAEARKAQATADAAAAMVESAAGMDSLFQSEAVTATRAADEITASWGDMASLFATDSNLIAEAAEREALAFRNAALAATQSAEEIAASADTAATESSLAGRIAGSGWLSMLGPVGAVIAGASILSMMFGNTGQAAQQAASDINTLTSALEQDNGAIGENTRLAALNMLQQQGVTEAAHTLGISINDLVNAALGQADAHAKVTAVLNNEQAVYNQLQSKSQTAADKYADANSKVFYALNGTNKELAVAIQNAKDYEAVQKDGTAMSKQQAAAANAQNAALEKQAAMYGLYGKTGVTAYQAAAAAALKNTQQTQAQTLAFQLENDAASLVNQALQTMAGQNLNVAQAQTAMDTATLSAGAALKQGKESLDEHTQAGLADRSALEGQAAAARTLASAVAQQTHSNKDAIVSYKKSKAALEDQLRAQGLLTPAVQAYINKLYSVKSVNAYLASHPTKLDVQDKASAKLAAIAAKINAVAEKLRGLNNKTFRAFLVVQANIKNAQALREQDIIGGLAPPQPSASGHRYAAGTNDAPAGWAWVGEQGPELLNLPAHSKVMPHAQSVAAAAGGAAAGPAVFHLYDADGVLIGTMRGQAQAVAEESARALTRQGARYGAGSW